MSRDAYIIKRLENIESELRQLRRYIFGGERKTISLQGVWEGVDISDEEIEEAKRSLAKGIEKYESG